MSKKHKYSRMQIEVAIKKICDGTESSVTVPGLVDRARVVMAKRRVESKNRTIYGIVLKRGASAILLRQINTNGSLILERDTWWPVSLVVVNDRALDHLTGLVVPSWLWDKRVEEERCAKAERVLSDAVGGGGV